MRDTARFGHTRSTELKAVDDAFVQYEKLGTGSAREALRQALDRWKRTHGPGDAWTKSERNKLRAVDRLTLLVEGRNDDDGAFGAGRVPDFMHEELVNARLGVLYLFGRLSVSPNIFKLVLDGGLTIAGQALKVAGAPQARSIVNAAAKAGPLVGAGGGWVEGKLLARDTPPNQYLPPDVAPSQAANEKATTVYAEQILRDAQAAEALANRPRVQKVRDKVQEWFDLIVEKIKETVRKKFTTVEGIAGTLKQLVKGCVALFAARATPIVGGALDAVAGLGKTLDAAVTRFRTWREGRDVEVAQGHPSTVVQSITRGMTLSLFEGLWQTLKGAAAITVDAVGFAAGGLVNLLLSIGELLIKFVWRLVEAVRMRAFCDEAAEHWRNQHATDALHRRPFAFADWYRGYALNLPAIAVLTLNTGICGDKMRYLTMFAAGGLETISAQAFQHGARFLDNLKPWGAKYLDDTGFSFQSKGDVLVDQLVKSFATSHEKEQSAYDRIIAVVTA